MITYADELLADHTVHRRYSDGRQEWRVRDGDRTVSWRDDRGGTGTDELLGRRIVKRSYGDGRRPLYGREGGFGRTLWSDGTVTVNRTSFGGRLGTLLRTAVPATGVAGVAGAGTLAAPPASLTAEEEDELRREAEAQASSSGGGEAGSGEGYDDWGGDGADDGGDFG